MALGTGPTAGILAPTPPPPTPGGLHRTELSSAPLFSGHFRSCFTSEETEAQLGKFPVRVTIACVGKPGFINEVFPDSTWPPSLFKINPPLQAGKPRS